MTFSTERSQSRALIIDYLPLPTQLLNLELVSLPCILLLKTDEIVFLYNLNAGKDLRYLLNASTIVSFTIRL